MDCPDKPATFAGRPIDEFAGSFTCPVVLVGPLNADQFKLNKPAAQWIDILELSAGSSETIEPVLA